MVDAYPASSHYPATLPASGVQAGEAFCASPSTSHSPRAKTATAIGDGSSVQLHDSSDASIAAIDVSPLRHVGDGARSQGEEQACGRARPAQSHAGSAGSRRSRCSIAARLGRRFGAMLQVVAALTSVWPFRMASWIVQADYSHSVTGCRGAEAWPTGVACVSHEAFMARTIKSTASAV
jgi:hypothetical protein